MSSSIRQSEPASGLAPGKRSRDSELSATADTPDFSRVAREELRQVRQRRSSGSGADQPFAAFVPSLSRSSSADSLTARNPGRQRFVVAPFSAGDRAFRPSPELEASSRHLARRNGRELDEINPRQLLTEPAFKRLRHDLEALFRFEGSKQHATFIVSSVVARIPECSRAEAWNNVSQNLRGLPSGSAPNSLELVRQQWLENWAQELNFEPGEPLPASWTFPSIQLLRPEEERRGQAPDDVSDDVSAAARTISAFMPAAASAPTPQGGLSHHVSSRPDDARLESPQAAVAAAAADRNDARKARFDVLDRIMLQPHIKEYSAPFLDMYLPSYNQWLNAYRAIAARVEKLDNPAAIRMVSELLQTLQQSLSGARTESDVRDRRYVVIQDWENKNPIRSIADILALRQRYGSSHAGDRSVRALQHVDSGSAAPQTRQASGAATLQGDETETDDDMDFSSEPMSGSVSSAFGGESVADLKHASTTPVIDLTEDDQTLSTTSRLFPEADQLAAAVQAMTTHRPLLDRALARLSQERETIDEDIAGLHAEIADKTRNVMALEEGRDGLVHSLEAESATAGAFSRQWNVFQAAIENKAGEKRDLQQHIARLDQEGVGLRNQLQRLSGQIDKLGSVLAVAGQD